MLEGRWRQTEGALQQQMRKRDLGTQEKPCFIVPKLTVSDVERDDRWRASCCDCLCGCVLTLGCYLVSCQVVGLDRVDRWTGTNSSLRKSSYLYFFMQWWIFILFSMVISSTQDAQHFALRLTHHSPAIPLSSSSPSILIFSSPSPALLRIWNSV